MKKLFLKKFRNIHRKTPALESLFNKVVGLQVLRTPMCGRLLRGATEMFILDFENKESICNVMSEIYKNCD